MRTPRIPRHASNRIAWRWSQPLILAVSLSYTNQRQLQQCWRLYPEIGYKTQTAIVLSSLPLSSMLASHTKGSSTSFRGARISCCARNSLVVLMGAGLRDAKGAIIDCLDPSVFFAIATSRSLSGPREVYGQRFGQLCRVVNRCILWQALRERTHEVSDVVFLVHGSCPPECEGLSKLKWIRLCLHDKGCTSRQDPAPAYLSFRNWDARWIQFAKQRNSPSDCSRMLQTLSAEDKNRSALGGARLMLLLGESVLLLFFRLFAHGLVRR